MSESPDPIEAQESTFRSWLGKVGNQYWPRHDKMPDGAGDAYNNYCHYRNNPAQDSPDHAKKDTAAHTFKSITGYEAEDFFQFTHRLDQEEK